MIRALQRWRAKRSLRKISLEGAGLAPSGLGAELHAMLKGLDRSLHRPIRTPAEFGPLTEAQKKVWAKDFEAPAKESPIDSFRRGVMHLELRQLQLEHRIICYIARMKASGVRVRKIRLPAKVFDLLPFAVRVHRRIDGVPIERMVEPAHERLGDLNIVRGGPEPTYF